MTEPSRSERYLKALEIAERNCNRFMAAKIRADRLPPPDQQMEPHHHPHGDTMTDHPITPPPELKAKWIEEDEGGPGVIGRMIDRAAQWGADQELEACCELLKQKGVPAWSLLRTARRPKPPSLKAQALALLDPSNTYGSITQEEEYRISVANADTIRRALEALPND